MTRRSAANMTSHWHGECHIPQCAGYETYEALQLVLTKMLECKSLTCEVTVPGVGKDGASISLNVVWHLGGDLKLVLLLRGHSGCSSSKPCPVCTWNRRDPWAEAEDRTESATAVAAELAAQCLPLWQAQKACQNMQTLRKELRVTKAVSTETAQHFQKAADETDACFTALHTYTCGPELPMSLRNSLSSASLVQRLKTLPPSVCFRDPTKEGECYDPRAHTMNGCLMQLHMAKEHRDARVACLRQTVQLTEVDQHQRSTLADAFTDSGGPTLDSTQNLLNAGMQHGWYCSNSDRRVVGTLHSLRNKVSTACRRGSRLLGCRVIEGDSHSCERGSGVRVAPDPGHQGTSAVGTKAGVHDHILIKHMLSEVDKLAPLNLSPVSVSSRFIEAGNMQRQCFAGCQVAAGSIRTRDTARSYKFSVS